MAKQTGLAKPSPAAGNSGDATQQPATGKRGRTPGAEATHVGLKLDNAVLKAAAVAAALPRRDPKVKELLKSFEAALPGYLAAHAKDVKAEAAAVAKAEWEEIEAGLARDTNGGEQ